MIINNIILIYITFIILIKFMKQTLRKIISLSKPALATKPFNMPSSVRYFRQTNDLNDLIAIAEKEEKQRSAKFVEYTQKVY